jgi:hypothetical protein
MSHQKRLTVNEVDPGAYQSILAMERVRAVMARLSSVNE